ncbi:MAG TPA: HAMP domain-containing sensor histidine kinase [Candidatus Ozemobacteraceae bacterium]|nr:HAMP domain-containing sensor histidine kinase [Candidatus Ozemobacteraceae bacterium]
MSGRRFLPTSLFARLFLLVSLLSCVLVSIGGYGMYLQALSMIDREANQRLAAGASTLAAHLWPYINDPADANAVSLFRDVLGPTEGLGWIRTVYWVDMSASAPAFLATLSFPDSAKKQHRPPSLDHLEDALDDGLDLLEAGRPYYPDPRFLHGNQQLKTIFMPIMDHHGFLHSFIGLEADSSLLNLRASLRHTLLLVLGAAVLSALLASLLIAGSVSRHADRLVKLLHHIEKREPVGEEMSGIHEFATLHRGLSALGQSIVDGDQRLHQMYEQKLNELFLMGGAIAHQLRNPLAAAELHLGLLRRNPSSSESLKELQLVLEQMNHLVTRFLGYSKKVQPVPQLLVAYDWLSDWATRLRSSHPDISISVQAEKHATLFADPDLLQEILANLIRNSIEAASAKVQIDLTATAIPGAARLCFQDHGPGIPTDLMPSLFAPFTSRKAQGTGLGLALVRKFVEAHHGRIEYQPGPSGGAGFLIDLPSPPSHSPSAFDEIRPVSTEKSP